MLNYNTYSDQELVALLRANDEYAFTEIYNRYWKLIYTHVYKILRNDEDTRDILQEVFSSLWLKAATVRPDANIAGMLYSFAKNRVFNLIEKNKVRNDYLSEIAAYVSDLDVEPIDQLDEKRIRLILQREIDKLPPKMKEIFELSRTEGFSHKEIAAKLDISEQTVKKQVQNALKVIKPKLRDNGLSIAILFLLR